MRIYLVRHGEAVPEEEAGSDRDRWLSARGRDHARALGRLLRARIPAPALILASPLPRAVQTAELLAHALEYPDVITSLRCLEPSGHPRTAAGAIQAHAGAIVVVSHEPILSSLGAFLLDSPVFPPFRTAQCRAIEDGKPTFSARADSGQIEPYQII